MLKKLLAVLLLLWPTVCMAQVEMIQLEDAQSGSTLVVFEVAQDDDLADLTRMALEMQIEARFAQSAARAALERSGVSINQHGWLYQDEGIVSMARMWKGDQADGRDGCSAATLTINLETGMEIYLDELFTDPDEAVSVMEAIIERDLLDDMNTYMENADLLPMPQNSYFVDETGLTVYWPQERYSYFDGSSGYVTFYWHEIADCIGENSPVYALSRPQTTDAAAILSTAGDFSGEDILALHKPLGDAMEAYGLTDEPDYTGTTILYPLSDPALRGLAVEIPKYAETEPEDTPICAVRHSRVSWHGLTTGKTTRDEIIALLGEPQASMLYDEEAADENLLDQGESIFYKLDACVLQAHISTDGMLNCIILRDAMPESLY